jgi:hypothetical protein
MFPLGKSTTQAMLSLHGSIALRAIVHVQQRPHVCGNRNGNPEKRNDPSDPKEMRLLIWLT